MSAIQAYNSSRGPRQLSYNLDARSSKELQVSNIETSSRENKNLTLLTKEGDKVTISSNQRSESMLSTYSQLSSKNVSAMFGNVGVSKTAMSMFQGERLEFQSSRSMKISVEGDLSDEEMNDIRKAVSIIDGMAQGYLDGPNGSLDASKVKELRELDTLSSVEAEYQRENTVEAERMVEAESMTYSRKGELGNIGRGRGRGPGMDPMKQLVEEMAKTIEDSGVNPSKFIEPVQDLFAEILADLKNKEDENEAPRKNAETMMDRLLNRVEQLEERPATRPLFEMDSRPEPFEAPMPPPPPPGMGGSPGEAQASDPNLNSFL